MEPGMVIGSCSQAVMSIASLMVPRGRAVDSDRSRKESPSIDLCGRAPAVSRGGFKRRLLRSGGRLPARRVGSCFSGADSLKVSNFRLTGHELQALGNALVRLLIKMAVMPELETLGVCPDNEPDFGRSSGLTSMLKKPGCLPPGAADGGRLPSPGGLVIGDDESAERDESCGGPWWQLYETDNRSRPLALALPWKLRLLLRLTLRLKLTFSAEKDRPRATNVPSKCGLRSDL
jgi:hypothetical protein